MLVVNYLYELPIFRDHSQWTGNVLGGWQITGITTFLSGAPSATQGWNLIRGPGMQQWDIALFKTFRPAEKYAFTLRGNCPRNWNSDGAFVPMRSRPMPVSFAVTW